MIFSNRDRAWMSFMTTKSCLGAAILVLTSARLLREAGLIGPHGISVAMRWLEHFIKRGMRIWHRRWTTRQRNKRWC
jgi:hypothetical protein